MSEFTCVFTESGRTAKIVSKVSKKHPVLAFTSHENICRKINLYKGVHAIQINKISNIDVLFYKTSEELLKRQICKPGDKVVIVTGEPLGKAGTTNMLKVHTVSD